MSAIILLGNSFKINEMLATIAIQMRQDSNHLL